MAAGTAKVYKQVIKAAALYGARCLGMAASKLQTLRREAGRALPGSAGMRSLTLQLAMAKADPYYEFTAAPPLEWASVVWDGRIEAAVLARAWRRQILRVGAWCHVRGPTGATLMSLRRAGWQWPAWHCYLTAGGKLLDLREVCPQDVAAMLKEDLSRKMWQVWCEEAPERR